MAANKMSERLEIVQQICKKQEAMHLEAEKNAIQEKFILILFLFTLLQ